MVEHLLPPYSMLGAYSYSTLMACDSRLFTERSLRRVLAQPTCWD
jgi:hypothetical protein